MYTSRTHTRILQPSPFFVILLFTCELCFFRVCVGTSGVRLHLPVAWCGRLPCHSLRSPFSPTQVSFSSPLQPSQYFCDRGTIPRRTLDDPGKHGGEVCQKIRRNRLHNSCYIVQSQRCIFLSRESCSKFSCVVCSATVSLRRKTALLRSSTGWLPVETFQARCGGPV